MLKITVLESGKPPRVHAFDRFPVSIGRGSGSDVALPGWKVARLHAEIRQLGAGYKLIDHGSLAGTYGVTGGTTSGAGGATAGQAQGTVAYLQGTGTTTFNVGPKSTGAVPVAS